MVYQLIILVGVIGFEPTAPSPPEYEFICSKFVKIHVPIDKYTYNKILLL